MYTHTYIILLTQWPAPRIKGAADRNAYVRKCHLHYTRVYIYECVYVQSNNFINNQSTNKVEEISRVGLVPKRPSPLLKDNLKVL